MKEIDLNMSKIHDKINDIYYKYFYNNYDNFFKTSVLETNIYKIIKDNSELVYFLDIINKNKKHINIKLSEEHIKQYTFSYKLQNNNIESFGIFVMLLQIFEKKEFFFNGFTSEKININLKFLINLYKQREYNLNLEEEFNKYKLIEITSYRELFWQEPRIIDNKYNITFDIKYINISIYKKIIELFELRNFKLSFYPNCINIKDYVNTKVMIFDSKEYGRANSLNDFKTMKLKSNCKFIDYIAKDKLYIKHNEAELTFEEIQNEPKFLDNEEILYTKVVHLIFYKENNELYLEHLDLEYIFYSIEEYSERFDSDNFEQKGNIIKRQKIFKIDNAKINLAEHLYELVYFSLDNKDLINEYFVEIGL
ncbi:MAG: hypothetical protein RBR59_04060 [Sulfurimonadaceae bacterium]|jgi:hypothetical protein|nr:hypothetical protein [Sulfurimonadaceae bacterium]